MAQVGLKLAAIDLHSYSLRYEQVLQQVVDKGVTIAHIDEVSVSY